LFLVLFKLIYFLRLNVVINCVSCGWPGVFFTSPRRWCSNNWWDNIRVYHGEKILNVIFLMSTHSMFILY